MLTTAIYTRPAGVNDRWQLDRLLGSTAHIHNHLDWQPPQDWLGQHPFRIAYVGQQAIGVLAAPPDPPGVAWVRLAAVAEGFPVEAVLDTLWADSRDAITEFKITQVNCMLLESWLAPHLQRWGYTNLNDVVVLSRPVSRPRPAARSLNQLRLRSAHATDLEALALVDNAAFRAPWQYSTGVIKQAMGQSSLVTVAELGDEIVGYQLSSGGRAGGHLARLAVRPDCQGMGIGQALVEQVVEYFDARHAPYISVNTQRDNASSLAVYKAFGFELTGEHYEVWQWLATTA